MRVNKNASREKRHTRIRKRISHLTIQLTPRS